MDNLSTPSPFTHCPKYFFLLEYRGIFVLCSDDDQSFQPAPAHHQRSSCRTNSAARRDVNQDGGPVITFNSISSVSGDTHHLCFRR